MPPQLKTLVKVEPKIALCYIRRSWVRGTKDLVSPQIQREAIQRVCQTHDWIAEWYEDAEGHKSGMYENNRPGWLALKARMSDPDVAAIVAYDLSRLHRRGWRIGDLLDFVDSHKIGLVLADPGKSIDFTTPQGRLMAQIAAIFDEYYAVDIGHRRRANIAYKKSLNKTVGLPPFGTKRDSEGYLIPSNEGAWFLPDGTWQAGVVGEEPPTEGAIWRGYFDCARRILDLYVLNKGNARICLLMREEGWAFRSRWGQPSVVEKDDIRRVSKAWIEYGGIVVGKRAKDRPGYSINPDEITLDPNHAVFDIAFLKRVGQVDAERSVKQPQRGHKVASRVYPLASLVHCASCETLAEKNKNPTLRSRLIGKAKTDERNGSYRHRPGLECGCTRKQVYSLNIEGDFLRLCQLLTLDEQAFVSMQSLAAEMVNLDQKSETEMEEKKTTSIAKCHRKLDAVRSLFEDGDLEREEYVRRKQNIERELAQWESYTTTRETISQQLLMCIDAVSKIAELWQRSTDEGRNGLAHNLFEEIVYDLDKQQIVSFKLKAWAEQFLVLRGQLYEDGNGRYRYAPSRNRICAFASGGRRSIR